MAFIFCDSFDHYAIADIERKWTQLIDSNSGPGGSSHSTSLTEGRRSTDALKLTINSAATSGNVTSQFPRFVYAPVSTVIFGFAFKHDGSNLSSGSDSESFSNQIWNLGSLGANQIWCRLNPDRTISVLRGTGTATVLGTTSVALNQGVYTYLEFKVVIHDTTGSVVVRKDGSVVLNLTNIDTRHNSDTVNNIIIGVVRSQGGGGYTFWFDDFYLLDSSGSTSNDFLNDTRIDVMYPNAEGNTIQWTPSTGTDNSALVDEAEANGDTDYNSTGTVNNKDTLAFPNAPVASTNYHAVQVNMFIRKEEAGPGGIKAVTRLGGTDYLSAEYSFSSDYTDVRHIWDRRPSDSGVWTDTDINGAEFGYQKSS
jgi:hypothetical protein